jgi:hypothetical protein
MIIKKF